jgi:hypothetical protein
MPDKRLPSSESPAPASRARSVKVPLPLLWNRYCCIPSLATNMSVTRFDISTDAWPAYTPEIDMQLSARANHHIVVKVYDKPEETREHYSLGDFVTVEKSVGGGNPDLERACTSHVERKNASKRPHLENSSPRYDSTTRIPIWLDNVYPSRIIFRLISQHYKCDATL